jgi:hypothetical protein
MLLYHLQSEGSGLALHCIGSCIYPESKTLYSALSLAHFAKLQPVAGTPS